jgi:hypothetical protein
LAPSGPRAVSPLNGQALWAATIGSAGGSCANCHGATKPDVVSNLLKINNAMGTAADQGAPATIRRGIQSLSQMLEFAAVSDADLADIAAYVNAVKWAKPLTDSSGAAPVKPFMLVQNGVQISSVTMPQVMFGAASSVRTTLSLQAPPGGGLHIERLAVNNPMFTINRVPVAISGQAATTLANSQACPPGAFDLQAGAACGIEVVFAVSSPGVVSATLQIYTDPAAVQAPEGVAIEATVTAEAKGGAGGGGCTMRSTPGLFDPVLLLLTVLAFGLLAVRRRKKNQVVVSTFK